MASDNGLSPSAAKPLPAPKVIYCQPDPYQQTSANFPSNFRYFHSRKWIWKCCLQNDCHFDEASVISTEASSKWQSFCRQHFQIHFLEWKYLKFDGNFIDLTVYLSWGVARRQSSNGLCCHCGTLQGTRHSTAVDLNIWHVLRKNTKSSQFQTWG